MEKKVKLTFDERYQLNEFYSKCVSENATFPSITPGTANVTIQDLVHNRTISTLDKYAEYLEKGIVNVSRHERRKGLTEKTLPGSTITYKSAVESIDIIIKDKEYMFYIDNLKSQKEQLMEKLENLKTPEEIRSELKKQLEEINGI